MMLIKKLFTTSAHSSLLQRAPITTTLSRAPFFTAQRIAQTPTFFVSPQYNMLYQAQFFQFSSQQKLMYGTSTPAKSNRMQRGLYHKKTHGRRYQRCFSMKKAIHTMKPNVKRKHLKSEILGQTIQFEMSMKARRCIMKAGSLDKYLLNTKPADIDSKFGLYVRELIQKKQLDPNFQVPYIKGTAKLPRSKKTNIFEYKQVPAIYMPSHVKIGEDHSKYFNKPPTEMSRYEISLLEQELREIDLPEVFVPDEEMFATEEFKDLKEQMKQIQPLRHGVIKKYFQKFKFQRKKRDDLLAIIERSEEVAQEILGDEFVHFKDAIPEIKTFLAEVEARDKLAPPKELLEEEEKKKLVDLKLPEKKKKGRKTPVGENADGSAVGSEEAQDQDSRQKEALKIEEVDFDPESFNPFDQSTMKKEKEHKPLQPRRVLKVKK